MLARFTHPRFVYYFWPMSKITAVVKRGRKAAADAAAAEYSLSVDDVFSAGPSHFQAESLVVSQDTRRQRRDAISVSLPSPLLLVLCLYSSVSDLLLIFTTRVSAVIIAISHRFDMRH